MIKVENLSRQYGTLWAVKDLSFEIADGQVYGLLGPNGAGKSTTVKIMVGMLAATTGEITINGLNIKTDGNAIKANLGFVPESCALYENLTGREHLEMVCNLHHLPVEGIEPQVTKLIELLDLKDAADKRIAGYSKGMKQKLLLAGGIIHNPRVLILDEPLSGLDANAQSLFRELIKEFARDNRIVIFCSHVLEVVERICDQLLIIDHGKKLTEGTPQQIMENQSATTLGEAFSRLTGATDIDDQARGILRAIERGNGDNG
ncbi:MAG: ABC transporter ATP-binding protein [candidate division Zixibacteria bacterium]|nr:ABC transporter ATP-binding protein [candidate division Zixibacteria bacterium]